ncbi:MAG: hypothetical protein M1814_001717 [Vezdaea aestivalis]|nr:MAG: hypothetical protein M1814_001717 [Vezdaea aestivalis]
MHFWRSSGNQPLLHSLGLSIFKSTFDAWTSRGEKRREPRKVALTKNRWWAAARCVIHLPSVGVSIVLLYLNLGDVYLGGELIGQSGQDSVKLGALQFAAKLHELAIHASLAAILYTYIRRELLARGGLPFGALVAGQRFKDLSYLWSTEFWGAVTSSKTHRSVVERTCLISSIVIVTLLAVVAAPASAIAMLPRLDLWDACGTSIAVNATSDTLWPQRVDLKGGRNDYCLKIGAAANTSCPSGGSSIIDSFSAFFIDRTRESVPPREVQMYANRIIRTLNITTKLGRNPDKITTCTSPTASIGDAIMVAGNWYPTATKFAWLRNRVRFWFNRQAYMVASSLQPITRVSCSNLKLVNARNRPLLGFPVYQTFLKTPPNLKNLSQQESNDIWTQANALNKSRTEILWRELPSSFINSTMGALVFFPSSNSTHSYTTCNVDSRFAESLLWRFDSRIIYGAPGNLDAFRLGRTIFSWSWKSVSASLDWARSLNPQFSDNTNAFNRYAASAMINSVRDKTDVDVVEIILAMMFTDGLARLGNTATIQGTFKGFPDPLETLYDGPWVDEYMKHGNAYDTREPPGANWVNFRLDIKVNGYSYSKKGWFVQFALVILLLHILFVLGHLWYCLNTGLSSGAWDALIEMLCLSINTAPTPLLQNTCAGVQHIEILRLPVRIVEQGPEECKGLQLEFDETAEEWKLERDPRGYSKYRVIPNKEYGWEVSLKSGRESGMELHQVHHRPSQKSMPSKSQSHDVANDRNQSQAPLLVAPPRSDGFI